MFSLHTGSKLRFAAPRRLRSQNYIRVPLKSHQQLIFHAQKKKNRCAGKVAALGRNEVGQEFDGLFGTWTLEEEDRLEVLGYRICLTVATIALVLDSAIVLLPDDSSLRVTSRILQNSIAVLGAVGLGGAYQLIHIYVAQLKRFLQALAVFGSTAGIYLIVTQDLPVTEYVATHREALWLVGPLFASVTGLGIKEGLCYGTRAAIGITLTMPILCLGHLSGLMPEGGTKILLVLLNLLAVSFAAGKYRQSLRGDIGDKSIFQVQSLPKEEQAKRWAEVKSGVDDT